MIFTKLLLPLVLNLSIILSGCATVNYMAIDKTSKKVDVSTKSILLMTLDFSRSDKSSYFFPDCISVNIEKPNAKSMADRINFFVPYENEKPYENKIITSDKETIYLLRMAIEPGEYRLIGITGMCLGFPNSGSYFVPLLMDINVQKNAVTYMGRIKVIHRPRKDNEFRAGPMIPLLDQAIAGISTGTFDITVLDMSKEDVGIFKSTFQVLKDTVIQTKILPDYDRQKVQKWWEGENKDTETK